MENTKNKWEEINFYKEKKGGELRLPAVSESQRRFFGMVLAYKRGELSLSDIDDPELRKRIKQASARMSEEEIRKYAKKTTKKK